MAKIENIQYQLGGKKEAFLCIPGTNKIDTVFLEGSVIMFATFYMDVYFDPALPLIRLTKVKQWENVMYTKKWTHCGGKSMDVVIDQF